MYLSVCLSVCPSVRLSVCPSVRLSVCPSVRLSVNCSNWVVSNKLTNRDCIEYKSPFVCLYYGIHRSGTPPCGQRMERETQCMRVISRDWFPVRSKVLSLFDCSNEGRDGPVALPATKITLSSFFMPHYESNIRTHEFKKQ